MEAKELMIGDYVSYIDTFGNRKIGKVTDLHHNKSWETIYVDFCDQNPEGKSKITSVRPIPLTVEILKNNGFIDVGDCIYQNEEQCCGVELNTFMFYVYENDYDNDNCHDVAQVFYVHQLQHALRLVGLTEMADNLKRIIMEQQIKPGDFVRLTDPLDNGTIVRIENVDENGLAEWLGGSQYCDMEQISMEQINPDLNYYYENLSELIRHIESKIGIKIYPESAVEYWKNRAEHEEKEHAYYEQAWEKEHSKLLNAQDEIAKLKEYIKKVCAESSADIQRLDAENKKLQKQLSELQTVVCDCGETEDILNG